MRKVCLKVGMIGRSFGQILVHQSLRQMRSKVFLKLGRMRFQKKCKLNQHKLSANNLIYLQGTSKNSPFSGVVDLESG